MVLMLGVKSSRDVRSKIQNGFWFFKYVIVIGITIGLFYVSSGSISSRSFSSFVISSIIIFVFITGFSFDPLDSSFEFIYC